jgi:hypothetical protein
MKVKKKLSKNFLAEMEVHKIDTWSGPREVAEVLADVDAVGRMTDGGGGGPKGTLIFTRETGLKCKRCCLLHNADDNIFSLFSPFLERRKKGKNKKKEKRKKDKIFLKCRDTEREFSIDPAYIQIHTYLSLHHVNTMSILAYF